MLMTHMNGSGNERGLAENDDLNRGHRIRLKDARVSRHRRRVHGADFPLPSAVSRADGLRLLASTDFYRFMICEIRAQHHRSIESVLTLVV